MRVLGKKVPRGFRGRVLFWVPPGYSCHVLETQKPLPSRCVPPIPHSQLGEAEALQTQEARTGVKIAFFTERPRALNLFTDSLEV